MSSNSCDKVSLVTGPIVSGYCTRRKTVHGWK